MTSRGVATLALTAVSTVSLAAYQTGRYVSLERGIAQTQENINLIDKAIQSTSEEAVDLANRTLIGKLSDSAQIAQDVAGINQAYNQNDVQGLVQHLAEATSDVAVTAIKATGKDMAAEGVAVETNPDVVAIKESFDAGVDVVILSNIGARLAQLEWVKHEELEPALEGLENKQQELAQEQTAAAFWGKLQKNFQDTSAKSLVGKDPGEVLKQAASISPQAAAVVGRRVAIRDPQQSIFDLQSLPGINPDFIAALQRCEQADAQAASFGESDQYYYNQMTCDKYPDGSYIPAFGPGRGIATPNPPTGATFSSNTSPATGDIVNDSPLAFTTGPSDTETIYVKGDNGGTGIGLFSQSIDQEDFGDFWELYDPSGTSVVHDNPQRPDLPNAGKQISGSVSPRDQPMWSPARAASGGSYIVKTGIIGMEPISVSVRSGYIAWVKIPHAVLQVGWDEIFHDALGSASLGSSILILDGNAQSIRDVLSLGRDMRDGVYVDKNWRRTTVKPGNYMVALGTTVLDGPWWAGSTKGHWTVFPEYHPTPITAVAGQVTRCNLVLGGYTVSTDSPNHVDWSVLSSDMKHPFVDDPQNVIRDSRGTDSKRVHVLYPGHYVLIWGDSIEMAVNHRYRVKRDFTVTESEVTNLIIPAK